MTDLELPRNMRNLTKHALWLANQNLAGFAVDYGEVEDWLAFTVKLEKRIDDAKDYGEKAQRKWRKQLRMAEAILRAANCTD
jgi:hypothetical protein